MKANDFKQGLKTKYIGQNIVYVEEVDSTNNLAKKSEAKHGTVFIADRQTKGKGRLGREWVSENDGLWMSVCLTENIPSSNVSSITLICGIAVCRALNRLCNINTMIKWPNDIVINGKKLTGILVEAVTEAGSVTKVVAGIGINVSADNFPGELKAKATSLLIETGNTYKREDVARAVFEELEHYYNRFIHGGMEDILREYESLCANIGKQIAIIKGEEEINGFARGISENGGLVVEINGELTEICSGEVSVRGIYGYV